METRLTRIDAWLAPASDEQIAEIFAKLGLALKSKHLAPAEIRALLALHIKALSDEALFALRDACDAFIKGDAGDGWMPPPGAIRQEAKKRSEPLRAERVQLKRVLEADVITERSPGDRERMSAMEAAVKKELRNARPLNEIARGFAEPVSKDEGMSPLEILERNAAAYRDAPITLSPEALATCRGRLNGDFKRAA